jgi:hypothetical protein
MKSHPCPDQESIAAFAAGGLAETLREEVFLHICSCGECRRSLRFACECRIADKQQTWPIVTAQEAEQAKTVFDLVLRLRDMPSERALLWLRFSQALTPVREVLAAADGQTPDQKLQTAALSGHICFFAECGKRAPGYWQAKIAIPTAPTPETELRIRIQDAQGKPVPNGVFILCGIELPVADGRAKVRLADLQGHLDQPIVALRFPTGEESHGIPKLFDTEESGLEG